MSDPLNGIFKELGELVGEVRAMKHTTNNSSMKLDQVGKQLVLLERLATTVEELVKDRDDHEGRLKTLESGANRRDGAENLLVTFLKSPLIGWMVASALFVIAWMKGLVRQ